MFDGRQWPIENCHEGRGEGEIVNYSKSMGRREEEIKIFADFADFLF